MITKHHQPVSNQNIVYIEGSAKSSSIAIKHTFTWKYTQLYNSDYMTGISLTNAFFEVRPQSYFFFETTIDNRTQLGEAILDSAGGGAKRSLAVSLSSQATC